MDSLLKHKKWQLPENDHCTCIYSNLIIPVGGVIAQHKTTHRLHTLQVQCHHARSSVTIGGVDKAHQSLLCTWVCRQLVQWHHVKSWHAHLKQLSMLHRSFRSPYYNYGYKCMASKAWREALVSKIAAVCALTLDLDARIYYTMYKFPFSWLESGLPSATYNMYIAMYSGTSECGHALGPSILSFVERLSSFRGYFVQSLCGMVHLVCPFFGVSFIGGFTVPWARDSVSTAQDRERTFGNIHVHYIITL